MVHKYYLSPLMKGIMIFTLVMMSLLLLVMLFLLFIAGVFHLPIVSVLLIMVVTTGIPVAAVIWRLGTPAVEISESGFKVSIPLLFKSNSATWNEIEGMTFGNIRTFLVPDKQLKILLKSEGAATKEIILSLKAVEKSDEIIAKLRERIPELTYQALTQSKVLQQPVAKLEVKYRKWTLTEQGITGSNVFVPWNDVKTISYSGLVIAGYGATTITYNNKQGKENSLIIKPKISPDYHDFIRYLVLHASHASIDLGLIKALEYSPADARSDMTATMLLVFAVVLVVILPIFFGAYSPTEGEPTIYLFMPFLLALLPMGMTIKLLAGRFRGKAEPASKKLLWSALSSAVQVLGVMVFLILSPFSAYYVLGDISMKTGSLPGAEHWYSRALEVIPDNIDVTFDMGLMYREKKEYETAFNYFEKAYRKNPKYFGPLGLELIPDTLLKMGRYDDSLMWCDKILDANRRKRDVQEVLGKKRDEIVAEKAQHGQLTQDQNAPIHY